jgi:hypothetical protein
MPPWHTQLVPSSIIELMTRYSWSGIQTPHTKELMFHHPSYRDLIPKSSWFENRDTKSSYQRAHELRSGTQRAHTKELMSWDPGYRAHVVELTVWAPVLRPHIVELESMSSSCSTPEIIPLQPVSYIPYHAIPYHTIPYGCIMIHLLYRCVAMYTISYCTTV